MQSYKIVELMDLLKPISERRSIRAFSNRQVEEEVISLLFEASRWAPSSMNDQPWKYYYTTSDAKDEFDRFIRCLNPSNRIWAVSAPVMILSMARKRFEGREGINRHSMSDSGAANALLSIQAAAMGLQVHQMGGYDMETTIKEFNIDRNLFEPIVFIAVGYPGDPVNLPPSLREKEDSPRSRKQISGFVTRLK